MYPIISRCPFIQSATHCPKLFRGFSSLTKREIILCDKFRNISSLLYNNRNSISQFKNNLDRVLLHPSPLMRHHKLSLFETSSEYHKELNKKIFLCMQNSIEQIIERPPRKGIMYDLDFFWEERFYSTRDRFHSALDRGEITPSPCFNYDDQRFYSFHLIDKQKPSHAIKRFFEGPTIADCGSTVEGIFFKAILEILGQEKFDSIFSNPSSKLQIKRFGIGDNGLLELFTDMLNFEASPSKLEIGSRGYINGIPEYNLKHPYGVGSGLHVICMEKKLNGQNLYWGLGLRKYHTEEEIIKLLVDDYNDNQTEEERNWLKDHRKEESSKEEVFKQVTIEEAKIKGVGLMKTKDILSVNFLGLIANSSLETLRLKDLVDVRLSELALELIGPRRRCRQEIRNHSMHQAALRYNERFNYVPKPRYCIPPPK